MAAINLTTKVFPSSKFGYNAKTKTLISEASTLGGLLFSPIRGTDLGFSVKSPRGTIVPFYVDRVERDAEQDVVAWVMRPTPEAVRVLRDCPTLAGTTLVVFND